MKPDALPQTVAIELSSACLLRCTYCERRHWREAGLLRKKKYLDATLYQRLIDELAMWSPQPSLTLSYEGESTLHPEFISLLSYTAGKGLRPWLTTSLSYGGDEILEAIVRDCSTVCISIDGPSENFRTRRGKEKQYDAVVAKLNRLLELRKFAGSTLEIVLSTVIDTPRSPELARVAAKWHGRVDTIFGWLEIETGEYLRLRYPDSSPASPRLRCFQPFDYAAVTSDGRISPCCSSSRAILPVDILAGFSAAWNSPAYRDFRRAHAEIALNGSPCSKCDLWADGWMADEPWDLTVDERNWRGILSGSTVRVTGGEA